MYALAADDVSARLEALLDHDPGTNDLSACCLYQVNQPLQCLSVCKEIIDQEHFVPFSEKLLRNDDVINSSVRVRLYLRTINLSCDIFRLCLFRKNDRNIKLLRYDTGNADTRSLYRKDFVDLGSLKAALEFLSDLPESAGYPFGDSENCLPSVHFPLLPFHPYGCRSLSSCIAVPPFSVVVFTNNYNGIVWKTQEGFITSLTSSTPPCVH